MRKGYVYSLSKDGVIFYIGSSTNPELRVKQHKNKFKDKYLDEVTNRFVYYDVKDIKMEIVEEMEFGFRDELYELEEYWINQFKAWNFPLRNVVYSTNWYNLGHKVPGDIAILLKKYHPNMSPYRLVDTGYFEHAMYDIIRGLQGIIHDLSSKD